MTRLIFKTVTSLPSLENDMSIKRSLRLSLREEVLSVTCNVCGKEEEEGQAFHIFGVTGGYESVYPPDMVSIEMVVCGECLEAWVRTFKDPDVSAESYFGEDHISVEHLESDGDWEVSSYYAYQVKDRDKLPEALHSLIFKYPGEGSFWTYEGNSVVVIKVCKEWPLIEGKANALVLYRNLSGESIPRLTDLTKFYSYAKSLEF